MLIRIFLRLFESFIYGGESGIRSVFDPYHAKAKKCLYAFFYACSNPLFMAERVGFAPGSSPPITPRLKNAYTHFFTPVRILYLWRREWDSLRGLRPLSR
jgi:hypothetical protein